MRIAVFGAGAVGAYFGGRLAAAGHDVVFIARGAHLAALGEGGLSIQSPKGDVTLPAVRATDDPSSVGPVDVVLYTVKMYDVEPSAPALAPLIGGDTAVLTLQNGVEVVDMVARHVGRDHVAGGAAYIVAVVDRPGFVRHTVADRLVFGEMDGRVSPRLEAFQAAGRAAGFVADLSQNIAVDLWVKFVRLSTWSGMTAATRSAMGAVRAHPPLVTMMTAALSEAMAVGQSHGIAFPPTLIDQTMEMVRNFPPDSKSSLLEDLERGRRLELPWLSGAVVRLGEQAGVATPTHAFLNAVLLPFVGGAGQQ